MGVAYPKRRREDMTVINCYTRSFFKKKKKAFHFYNEYVYYLAKKG